MWKLAVISVLFLMATSDAMEDTDMQVPECASHMRHFAYAMIPAHVRVYIKKMVTKEMKSCLDVKINDVGMEITKDCIYESGAMMAIKEMIDTGIMPDMEGMAKTLEKYYRCTLDAAGLQFNETDVNIEQYKKVVNSGIWEGTPADITKAEELMNNCIETSNVGSTFVEKLHSIEKCFMMTSIDYCESEGLSTGLLFTLFAGLKTIKDVSVCDSVTIDPKYKAYGKQCLADEVKKIGELPDEIKNEQNKMEKSKKLMKRFVEKVIYPVTECMGVKLGVYDVSTKNFNAQAGVNIVAGFPGWDSNETKDKITGQIRKCSKEFSNDYANLNITETMKTLWKEKLNYERCFWPMYVRTCGMNSNTQLTRFFAPLLDKECRGELHNVFMETTGKFMDVNLKEVIQEKMASLMRVLM